jgi:hypothetical protein
MLVHLAALFWEGRRMIESLMLCGIGLLAGCLLMLLFFPAVHQRAVRLTRRDLIDATPLTAKEIQAEKDQLRAQFAVSVRRLEVNMEQMRLKALERTADRQTAEMARLQVDLDKKNALILAMRMREEVRRRSIRRIVKLLSYLFARSNRRPAAPQWRASRSPQPVWDFEREPDAGELASTAAAIAAVGLKRRQASTRRYSHPAGAAALVVPSRLPISASLLASARRLMSARQLTPTALPIFV